MRQNHGRSDFKQALQQIFSGVSCVSHLVFRARPRASATNNSSTPPGGWQPGYRPPTPDNEIPRILRAGSTPNPFEHLSGSQQIAHLARALESRLQQETEALLSAQRAVLRAQKKVFDERLRALTSRSKLKDTLGFIDIELETILDAISDLLPQQQNLQLPNVGKLQSSLQNALRSYAEMRNDIEQLCDSDITLLRLDSDLSDANRRFAGDVEALVFSLGLEVLPARAEPPIPGEVDSEMSSSHAPSLLTQYFDRRGDIQIWRERVTELDVQHAELSQDREVRRDRSEELSVTDEEFEGQYQSVRRQHIISLGDAETDTARLELACKARGLDTSLNQTSSLESDGDQSPLVGGTYVVVPQWIDQISSPPAAVNMVDGEFFPFSDQNMGAPRLSEDRCSRSSHRSNTM